MIDSSCFSLVLPTPAAGRTRTSIAASSGSSSLRCTSIGPLTAPIIVYPFCEKVAEPSVLWRCERSATGSVDAGIVVVARMLIIE